MPCRALSPNLKGQDYFVGDIHGQFAKLRRSLEQIGFDPERDRLIAVGDLVDRGGESQLAHEWLEQPFFFSVRGNHEDLYLRWRSLKKSPEHQAAFEEQVYFRPRNGGAWVKTVSELDHKLLEHAFSRLPYFIAVGHASGKTVGVVHAELPDGASWPALLQAETNAEYLEGLTWGRTRIDAALERLQGRDTPLPEDLNHIPGLDAVIVGHAVVPQVQVLGEIVYSDTGAWHPSNERPFALLKIQEVLECVGRVKAGSSPGRLQPILAR